MRRNRSFRTSIVVFTAVSAVGGSLLSLASPAFAATQPFTSGDLAVYTVPNTSSAAQPVSIDEYSPSGASTQAPVESIPLPTTTTTVGSATQYAFTDSGHATSAGALTLSGNGEYLLAAAYDLPVGTAGATTAATTGVVARVDANANVDTTTSFGADNNNVRGAYSPDGTTIYVTGGQYGVEDEQFGASSATPLDTSVTNLRSVNGTGSQLYVSGSPTAKGNSPATDLATVGSGFPTTAPQTVTDLAGIPSSSDPYQFVLLTEGSATSPNVLYYADGTLGVIEKYSLESGTWVANGSIAVPSNAGGVLYGLTGQVTGGNTVQLFATSSTSAGTSGYLYSATDSTGPGVSATATATLLATAPSGDAFRGVAFVPQGSPNDGATPEVPYALALPIVGIAVFGGYVALRRRHRIA